MSASGLAGEEATNTRRASAHVNVYVCVCCVCVLLFVCVYVCVCLVWVRACVLCAGAGVYVCLGEDLDLP